MALKSWRSAALKVQNKKFKIKPRGGVIPPGYIIQAANRRLAVSSDSYGDKQMSSMSLLMLLLILPRASGAPIKPRFSWETIMPFFHSSNSSGPFTDEAIKAMSAFPMVGVM